MLKLKCNNVRQYQYAVEELVDKQAKHADDDVKDVQEEEDIHDDCFVPSCECALVSHETCQEDDLIQQLREKRSDNHQDSACKTSVQPGQCKEHGIQFL